MLSAAKQLLFRAINNLRRSSSPVAPQNDANAVFFSKLLRPGCYSMPTDQALTAIAQLNREEPKCQITHSI